MGKIDNLYARINKLEKLLIREMAKATNLAEENKRLKDGSLAEYYKKKFYKLEQEHVRLTNEIIIDNIKRRKNNEPEFINKG